MDICDRRGLKAAAGETLRGASYDPKKLILIHTGAILALSLLSLVLSYVIEQQISATGGLSGIGTRAVLETVQSVVDLVQAIALPFWQFGWICTAVRLCRREPVGPVSLCEGFRKIGPFFRLYLIQVALYFGIAVVCCYIASLIFAMTSWAEPFTEVVMQIIAGTGEVTQEQLQLLEASMVPLMGIVCVVFMVVAVPVTYRLRLAQYHLMDHPEQGARAALRASRRMMKGNIISMMKLDLSFWWFYVLELLVTAVAYLNLILSALGVTLPWGPEVSYFGAFVLYSLCQLGLYLWQKARVDVTYAAVYDALREPEERIQPLEG